MCFTRRKYKEKKFKKNIVVPENKINIDGMKISEIGRMICEERLFCENCKKFYPSEQFKMNCNGCDKLFHCGTAGRCIGDKCKIIMSNGLEYRMPYCLNCVDLSIDINTKNSEDCLCKNCQN